MSIDELVRTDRRAQIIEQAGLLFGAQGYERTSMRDIAAAVGMLPGSMYYHFASKEALLAAIYAAAIDHAVATIECAVQAHRDPWDRLEAAAVVHLQVLLGGGLIAAVVADDPSHTVAAATELIRQRHRYEAVFRRLVDDLALPAGVSASSFRLALLGSLNWALTWFKPGGASPEAVARGLFAVFRANQANPNRI